MDKQEIDQLFLDHEAFVKKIIALMSQKDSSNQLDEFIISLIYCDYPDLFGKLLDVYSSSIWMTASANMDAMTNILVDLENEAPIQKAEEKSPYEEAMKSFLIAFYEFDPNKLK